MRRLPAVAICLGAALCAAGPLCAEIKDRIAAVVNGQPIPLSDIEERMQVELSRVSHSIATSPEKERERSELIKRGLEQLVDERLIEAEANSLGLEVTEDEVQKQVEALAKQNGMEVAAFRDALGGQGIDFDTVRDSLRRQALQFRLLQYKVKPRKVSDEEVQAAYAAQNAEREYEVRARNIFIATPEGGSPERLQTAQAKAEQALRRIRSGDEFALVARDLSESPTAHEGGDLGYFRKGNLFAAADQAVFALKSGEVTPLLKTPEGYHVFKVIDRRPIAGKPLSEVQEDLRNRLAQESVLKERENYLRSLRKGAQVESKL